MIETMSRTISVLLYELLTYTSYFEFSQKRPLLCTFCYLMPSYIPLEVVLFYMRCSGRI